MFNASDIDHLLHCHSCIINDDVLGALFIHFGDVSGMTINREKVIFIKRINKAWLFQLVLSPIVSRKTMRNLWNSDRI